MNTEETAATNKQADETSKEEVAANKQSDTTSKEETAANKQSDEMASAVDNVLYTSLALWIYLVRNNRSVRKRREYTIKYANALYFLEESFGEEKFKEFFPKTAHEKKLLLKNMTK